MSLFNFNWKKIFWKIFYSRWRRLSIKRIPGYTILLPAPADLPVFIKIALQTFSLQNHDHLIEVLIIPDKISRSFFDFVETSKSDWHHCPIRIIKMSPLDRLIVLIVQWLNRPIYRHWIQLIRGAEAVKSTHAVAHDADLFITEKDFLERHYETCLERRLACLGVEEVWNKSFKEKGFGHLVATWEMIFEVEWFQSFMLLEHRCQKGIISGKSFDFDTTLLPQCLTPAEKISRHKEVRGFIHFNYVIITYRKFKKSKGPYEDGGFCLLLLRLLVDMYDDGSGWIYEVPTIDELKKGLRDHNQRVTYLADSTRKNYPLFRSKLQKLIDSEIFDGKKMTICQGEIYPFDKAFDWTNA